MVTPVADHVSVRRIAALPLSRARALTLIEMVVSLSIVSILMLAMGSSILVMARALPAKDGPAKQLSELHAALDQIADEAQYAVHVTEISANAFAFTVADRASDTDLIPERIRFAWGGVNTPITRSYNGGAAVALTPPLTSASLALTARDVTETYPGAVRETANGRLSYALSTELATFDIDPSNWMSQYVALPSSPSDITAPANTLAAFLTEVRVMARGDSGGTLYAQVRLPESATGRKPMPWPGTSAAVLGQNSVSTLSWGSSFIMRAIPFSPNVQIDRVAAGTSLQPFCIVFLQGSGLDAARVRFDHKVGSGQRNVAKTYNYGTTWNSDSDEDLRYELYGRYRWQDPDQRVLRRYVTSLQLAVEPAAAGSAALTTTIPLWNAPQVHASVQTMPALWESDFPSGSAPGDDFNGDGQPDWKTGGGSLLNLGAILNLGLLNPGEPLYSWPENNFLQPTTVIVRFRTTSNLGSPAYTEVRLNADWRGDGKAAPLMARLRHTGSGQTFEFRTKNASGSEVKPLMFNDVTGLSTGLHEVRMVVDPTPSRQTVAVWLNKQLQGTFAYERSTMSASDKKSVSLIPSTLVLLGTSFSEFDYAYVYVGGTAQ